MPQILIRHLGANVVSQLKERAKRHRRSLEAEARTILEEAIDYGARIEEFREWSDQFRQQLSGRPQSDSVELLRQDRER